MDKNFLRIVFKELRPHQWVKNFLIFLPIITSHSINYDNVIGSFLGFVVFSLAASSIYIVNDILDIEDDRKDLIKKHRPIASGDMSIKLAMTTLVLLTIIVACICLFIKTEAIFVLIIYYVFTTIYSLKIKTIPIADIFSLSLLYVIRILFGQCITGIHLSDWLIVFCIFFFLSLAFMKRISELYQVQDEKQTLSKQRSYRIEDLNMLVPTGISCGLISAMIIGLYINSNQVKILYNYPARLWVVACALLFWKMRLWFLNTRRLIDRDPVVFVIKDKTTYIIALVILCSALWAK